MNEKTEADSLLSFPLSERSVRTESKNVFVRFFFVTTALVPEKKKG